MVSDGVRELAIVSPARARLYRRGVDNRIRKLLQEYSVLKTPLREGDFVVNFGANIGELTLGLIETGCRVTPIEPDPATLVCLRRNVGHLAEIEETGLWKSDGDLVFYQKPDSADTTAIDPVGEPVTIAAKRLDTLLAKHEGRIRLIVGDAEGAEPEVLEGATETLKRTDYLSIAVGPERSGQMTDETCKAIARTNGFEILPSFSPRWMFARNRTL